MVRTSAGRRIRTENLGCSAINCHPNPSPLHNTYVVVFVFLWDRQIEEDSKAGKFDHLIQQAEQAFG